MSCHVMMSWCQQCNVTEPIGRSAPKFSGASDLSRLSGQSGAAQSLSCPAQASPPPSHRSRLGLLYSSWVSWSISPHFNINLKCCLSEPVGTSAPRFSSSSESLGVFRSATGKSFNFVCPAQASPVPSHRLGKLSQKPLVSLNDR